MKKKYLYMMVLGVICLLGFVLRPTLAKFTSSYTTDDDIVGLSFDFNIGISNIEEYEEVNVSGNSYYKFNVEITNSSSSTVYYGVWYKLISPSELPEGVTIARLDSTETTTSGSIDNGVTKIVTVIIINDSDESLKFNIGVVSSTTSTEDIEYLGGRKLVSGTAEEPVTGTLASTYVQNLYNDGSTINTVNIGGDSVNPTVSLNATQGIMLDNNGNYRYYGANPNNYVSYNGELWRIISVGNVKASESDTTGETRVKIIRAETIGEYSYDSSESTVNSGYGVNDWSKSDLMTELNTLYYNSTSGTCYTGYNNTTSSCDFTNIGLSETARSLTADALYYLGGNLSNSGLYADDYYTFERGTTVWGSTDGQICSDGACPRATIWTGRVGVMYPSDYVYATDLSLCTNTGLNYSVDANCYEKDWLFDSYYLKNESTSYFEWTLTPFLAYAFSVNGNGIVDGAYVGAAASVRPVQYLKTDVQIVGGSGTSGVPYQLSIG